MSIETDINRIATALEELVKIGRGGVMPTNAPVNPAPKVPASPARPAVPAGTTSMGKGASKPAGTVVPPPALDPITGDPVNAGAPVVTREELHAALEAYMLSHDIPTVQRLMVKYGGNKVKPSITSIPSENYAKLLAAAKANEEV